MDSAHFVMGAFLCCVWSFLRLFMPSAAARKRLNVLGAVDALSKEVTFMTNITYINAQTVVGFLFQLREKYPRLPLYLVLDNARYQHCQLVKQVAQTLHIHLLFLPTYSPNLNLIERLWKWVKKSCLYACFYEDFAGFSTAIQQTLLKANSTHQQELESLLTLNFQRFDKSVILPV